MLRGIIQSIVEGCKESGSLVSENLPPVVIEVPADPSHGDFAINVAMQLARGEKKAPRAVAEIIKESLLQSSDLFETVEIAGPGFINLTLKKKFWQDLIAEPLQLGGNFGKSDSGQGRPLQVEFVSANPTGPLHIGHGRGAAIGDTLCRLMEATGWSVTREFYYNDAGQQISNLALSVQARCLGVEPGDAAWPQDGYQGDYIKDLATAFLAGETVEAADAAVTASSDAANLDDIRRFAVAYLRREQDADLKAFDVGFDNYFLESSLYAEGMVEAAVERIIASGHTYEADGALWLKTTDFDDDKDRVMRKQDGGYTYFVPDVAYHLDKWQRGFVRVINEQGADHHSTITRVRAGLQALDAGIPKGWPEYLLHQMVTVTRGGEEVKISKRAGSYVTLRDLIDEVGRDATRYFFLMRKADSQQVFDIDLAREQSSDNPVYYVQYAHARICRLLESAVESSLIPLDGAPHAHLLVADEELEIMKKISAYPETVESAATNLEPHRVAAWLHDMATLLHSFYSKHRVLGDDQQLTLARLYLLASVRQTLANGLQLLGVTAPEKM